MNYHSPIIILVRPQMGENIGAVARAMSNFGLSELRLVTPRDGWPNPKAWEMAAGGKPIIEAAQVFPDFVSAMHDIQIAYATTARPRDMEKRVVTPDVAMAEITGELKTAFVFGPERTGLENEEITWCDTIITIPTAPENFSLNLGQSMVVLGYEWWKVASSIAHDPALKHSSPQDDIAPKSHWDGLFSQLETYLDEADFFRALEKKPIMWQNLRTSLLRARMSPQEIQTLRGVFRVLYEGRRPRV